MTIRTVEISPHIYAQGPVVSQRGTRATVRTGENTTATGLLVGEAQR